MNFLNILICVSGIIGIPTSAVSKPAKKPTTSLLPYKEIFKRSVADSAGDIFLLTQPGNFLLNEKELSPSEMHVSHIEMTDSKTGKKYLQEIPPHPQTTHGYAWDYDIQIPIAFYDPTNRYFKKGNYEKIAVQQDIAPTLAAILGIPAPSRSRGRVLTEAFIPAAQADIKKHHGLMSSKPPKAIVIFVQDQVGKGFLAAHPTRHPFIAKLISNGASFTNGYVAHVDVETAVGHAAVGTGGYPRDHMIGANVAFSTGTWTGIPAFNMPLPNDKSKGGYSGSFLAPTLGDVWSRSQNNRPRIFAMAAAGRASIAMGGHGNLFKGAEPTWVTWIEESGADIGKYVTEASTYHLPKAMEKKNVESYIDGFLANRGDKWFDHPLRKPDGSMNFAIVRSSPVLPAFESDLAVESISELGIGNDEVTDLIWINMKSTDYCGHLFGYESAECGDVLESVDSGAKKIVDALNDATGGDYLAVFTADHGCAPLPELSGAVRYDRQKLLKDINEKFDRLNNSTEIAQFATSSQIYINRPELAANGHQLKDVVTFLKKFETPMAAPYNSMADSWIKKGKPKSAKFFYDVILKDDLK